MPRQPPLSSPSRTARKRVLIVNAFFDEYRRTTGSPYRVPRAMGPVYLAGAFDAVRCDVRLYSEQYSGPLLDPALLGWPDMLVLTGVTSSFDRMLHLTAYARTLNERVVVVTGGPPVRALPQRARHFFDYACLGDIEELQRSSAMSSAPIMSPPTRSRVSIWRRPRVCWAMSNRAATATSAAASVR
jgi:hypothetical protein